LLTVATTTLGAGTVGVAFSATLNASGGTLTGGGGYTWSVSGLPSGLGLSNGVISGTPQGPVTGAQVVLTVRDSVCQQVSATVGMTIDDTEAGSFSFVQKTASVWFGGRLVSEGTVPAPGGSAGAVFQDRLGTNRVGGARFYPYGEEIGAASANDRVKFGTYTRDSFTGLDYADQRFYASSYGRFNTADQYQASAGPKNPGSWNRYAYVEGDPINAYDPRGQSLCSAENSFDDCGGEGGFWGGEFGDAQAQNVKRLAGVPARLADGVNAYLLGIAQSVPPKAIFPGGLESVIKQAAGAVLSAEGLTSEETAAVLAGLTQSTDATGGNWNLEITQAGLASALCAGSNQCDVASNLWNAIASEWNGVRDDLLSNSAHAKVTGDSSSLEFHVDCFNNSAGLTYSVLHGLVDVFFGTVLQATSSMTLDRACGIAP
jgi:RHS repeat-associated protein